MALEQITLTEMCTTTPGFSLRRTVRVLRGYKPGYLPTIDERQLSEIISSRDLVGTAINPLQQHEEIRKEVEAGENLKVD